MKEAACAAPIRDLGSLRVQIDEIDARLVELMAERLRVARMTAPAKEAEGVGMVDLVREAEVVRRAAERARARGVDSEGVRDVFWRLIGMSRNVLLASSTGDGGEDTWSP